MLRDQFKEIVSGLIDEAVTENRELSEDDFAELGGVLGDAASDAQESEIEDEEQEQDA